MSAKHQGLLASIATKERCCNAQMRRQTHAHARNQHKRKKGRPKPHSHAGRMRTPFTPKESNTNDFDRSGQECQPRSHLRKSIPMLFTDWERNAPFTPKENNSNTMHTVGNERQTHLHTRRAIPPVFTHQDFDDQRKLGEN